MPVVFSGYHIFFYPFANRFSLVCTFIFDVPTACWLLVCCVRNIRCVYRVGPACLPALPACLACLPCDCLPSARCAALIGRCTVYTILYMYYTWCKHLYFFAYVASSVYVTPSGITYLPGIFLAYIHPSISGGVSASCSLVYTIDIHPV